MNSIFHNFKYKFLEATILNKLIYINVGLFLIFSMLEVFSFIFQFSINPLLSKLYLPANNNLLIYQPWSFITYMFFHNGFTHLLFNMIWLHFTGKIFLQHLHAKQLLYTYILGGISGGLLFIIAYNYIPSLSPSVYHATLLGASASVLAIVIATATYTPNYHLQLPFIGSIKLKYVALTCLILDILSIPKGNTGGHIAHLGGALFGYLYIRQLKKTTISNQCTSLITRFKNIFKAKPKLKTVYRRAKSDQKFNKEKVEQQKSIDLILDKIAKSGYESLNKKEKEILFSASKK